MPSDKLKYRSCYFYNHLGVTWFRQGDRSDTYKHMCSPNYIKNWKKINAESNFVAADAAIAA